MHSLAHSLFSFGTLLAVLITAGVGVLIFCCLSCSNWLQGKGRTFPTQIRLDSALIGDRIGTVQRKLS